MNLIKITISGRIRIHDARTKQPPAPEKLKEVNGAIYNEDLCSNYLPGPLSEIGLAGGSLRIVYVDSADGPRVVTEYESPRQLTAAELAQLAEETQGQWSDGIGSGCFDDLQKKSGLDIDLAPMGMNQDVRAEQSEAAKTEDPAAQASRKFLTAVRKGNLQAVQAALQAGANIEAQHQGFPALHVAIGGCHIEIVRQLLENGANPNSKNITGGVPLNTCATQRDVNDANAAAMAQILLQHGADVNFHEGNWTPLDYAINRDKKALQMVLKATGGISVYYAKNPK